MSLFSEKTVIILHTKARLIAEAALKRKANGVHLMDMRKVANFTDYFVIASGNSTPQLKAIADEVTDALRQKRLKPIRREGDAKGGWILIDCGNVVVHILHQSMREFYRLEELWGDAKAEVFSNK